MGRRRWKSEVNGVAKRRRGERGSIGLVLLFTLPLVIALSVYVYRAHQAFRARAKLQEAADASALHAAKMQARLLDGIALTNDGLVVIATTAGIVFVGGHTIGLILDVLVITAPEGIMVHKYTTKAVDTLREIAKTTAKMQDGMILGGELAPLVAAQIPLLPEAEPGWILLPYPIPGVAMGDLSLAMPLGKRGFVLTNLLDAAAEKISDSLTESLANVDHFLGTDGSEDYAEVCHHVRKTDNYKADARRLREEGEYLSSYNASRKARDENAKVDAAVSPALLTTIDVEPIKRDMKSGCREFGAEGETGNKSFLDGIAKRAGESLGEMLKSAVRKAGELAKFDGDSIAGFPTPLILDRGYAERYQVGIVAIGCRPGPGKCNIGQLISGGSGGLPYMAIAQARAWSSTQNRGGDIFIPDFKPRLVPVTAHKAMLPSGWADKAGGFLAEGPWAPLH